MLSTSIYLYLGYKGGTYLDSRFESAPVFLLVGLVLGIGLSFASLMSEILALTKQTSKRQHAPDAQALDREKSNNSTMGRHKRGKDNR